MLSRFRKENQNKFLIYMRFIALFMLLQTFTVCFLGYHYFKRDFYIKVELNQHKVNLNTAGVKQLSTLDNIGLNTAEKIIKGRPYKDIGDIYERGYIGHKTFLNIKEKIKVED